MCTEDRIHFGIKRNGKENNKLIFLNVKFCKTNVVLILP